MGTAAWIPILSPRFVSSDSCRRELHTFIDALQQTNGGETETRSRIFKVVKTLVSLQQQPEIMQKVLGYDFYRLDETGRPRELPDRDPAPDAEKKYLAKLDDLAYDLHLLLKKLKELEQQKQPVSSAGSIYLAETTQELSERRDQIRRELLAQGYQVLPDRPLPCEVNDLTQYATSQLSILPSFSISLEAVMASCPTASTRNVPWYGFSRNSRFSGRPKGTSTVCYGFHLARR